MCVKSTALSTDNDYGLFLRWGSINGSRLADLDGCVACPFPTLRTYLCGFHARDLREWRTHAQSGCTGLRLCGAKSPGSNHAMAPVTVALYRTALQAPMWRTAWRTKSLPWQTTSTSAAPGQRPTRRCATVPWHACLGRREAVALRLIACRRTHTASIVHQAISSYAMYFIEQHEQEKGGPIEVETAANFVAQVTASPASHAAVPPSCHHRIRHSRSLSLTYPHVLLHGPRNDCFVS